MPTAIIIKANYVPESPSTTITLSTFSYIARYDFRHTGRPTALRNILKLDADAIASAMLSWKHTHDFFESSRGRQKAADYLQTWSRLLMASKKPVVQTTDRPTWKGFLERPLTEEELEACDNWKPQNEEIFEHYIAIVSSGIDVSSSYSAKLKATTCTFKDQRPDSPTAGYALSARGDDAVDSLKLMIYKHTGALQGDWKPLLGNTPRVTRG